MGADERARVVTCATLDADIANAQNGDVIRLAQGQVCNGNYNIPPSVAFTIVGDGTGASFAPTTGRALSGTDVAGLTLRNLSFTGGTGSPGGAIMLLGNSAFTIDDVDFTGNQSTASGGALYAVGGWVPARSRSRIRASATARSWVATPAPPAAVCSSMPARRRSL